LSGGYCADNPCYFWAYAERQLECRARLLIIFAFDIRIDKPYIQFMNIILLTLYRVITSYIVAASLLCVVSDAALAQGEAEWKQGAIVGLRAGVCIREGPGVAYRTHTCPRTTGQ